MNWIRVEDSLPNTKVPIRVKVRLSSIRYDRIDHGSWYYPEDKTFGWCNNEVTHWSYLDAIDGDM